MARFDFPFEINYENILKTKDVLPMVRLLAADLMKNPYMTLGSYFQTAKDTDLELILEASEDEEDERLSDILLMAEMLARAEGVTTEDFDDVHNHLNIFITLAAVASLDRKDLIDADYDVMSFGEEFAKHVVAKRKE
ncbi:hypothetical protein UFOVP242_195 [uncultured Caudovirales phage]|uniref:Uncharacterized protein n=1 Tax=uncultured Caudovirales phage TaxID=2100421 RepID=A0A6J7WVH9_9CAUD|nr:hypothetical protein UFOVP242_195 [uncultured Caudovirales phage]